VSDRSSVGFRIAAALACVALAFLIAPIFMVVPVSFTPERYLSLPTSGISFRHYLAILHNEVWLASLGQSIVVAIAAAAIALVAGVLYSVGSWRLGAPWSAVLIGLALLPLIVPAIVNGVAFFRAWIALDLIDTYVGVILAHAITSLPYVVIGCSVALANLDRRLEQAARGLGASALRTTWSIIVPNILPGIVAGGIFAFVASWDELVVLLFITSRNIYLLPRAIWDGINENVDPTIAAIATLLIALTILGLLVEYWWSRRRATAS
jgi:putative spermidine/putrescine transport system permease protein